MRARSARLFLFGPNIYQRSHRRNRGISGGDVNARRKFDLRRWRTFRSLQSIRRHLDLSLCRQLQNRQNEYHSTFQRRTGFSPPSSQDKIFGNNFGLKPEEDLGWDIGIRQQLWQNRVDVGLTYFHNDLSNVIGFNGLFDTLNLGSAETQGLEAELHAQPIPNLVFTAAYTYLEAEKLPQKTFRSCKARVCRVGRAMRFTFQRHTFGGKGYERWSKQSSSMRARN